MTADQKLEATIPKATTEPAGQIPVAREEEASRRQATKTAKILSRIEHPVANLTELSLNKFT